MRKNISRTFFLLVIIALAAFCLRSLPFINAVYQHDGILFYDSDPHYHLNRVLSLLEFGKIPDFDYYLGYPKGAACFWSPLLEYIIVGTSWLVGLGNLSEKIIVAVSTWVSPFIAFLTIFLMYLIGKNMFGVPAGLISALLLTVNPSHMEYSKLGRPDHHVLEVFFTLLMILFFIKVLKNTENKKCYLWAAATGMAIMLNFLSWPGAIIYTFVIILVGYIMLLTFEDYFKLKRFLFANIIILAIGIITILPFSLTSWWGRRLLFVHSGLSLLQPALIFVSLLNFVVFFLISKASQGKKLIPWILSPIISVIVILAVTKAVIPQAFTGILSGMGILGLKKPDTAYLIWVTIINEYQPLFADGISFQKVLFFAGPATVLLPVGVVLLVAKFNRYRQIALIVLITALCFGYLNITYVRYGYIFSFAFAILGSFASVGICRILDGKTFYDLFRLKVEIQWLKTFVAKVVDFFPRLKYNIMSPQNLWIIIVVALIGAQLWFVFKIGIFQSDIPACDRDLYETCTWIRDNTPTINSQRTERPYYGIMNFWDIGHHLIQIAKRPAVASPLDGIGVGNMVDFYLAKSEHQASKIMDATSSRYVVTSDPTPVLDALRKISLKYPDETYKIVRFQAGMLEIPKFEFLSLMITKLHLNDGAKPFVPDMDVEGLTRYRLVYESKTNSELVYSGGPVITKKIKVFEYVKGARYRGKTKPNSEITVELSVKTNTDRVFIYTNTFISDQKGNYELILPYATQTSYETRPLGDYKIRIGSSVFRLKTTDEDVVYGKSI